MSLRTVGGKILSGPTTRINTFLNSAFRATAGTVEVRRNLAANPSAEGNLGYIPGAGAGVTLSIDTTDKYVGTSSVKVVTDGTVGSQGVQFATANGTWAVGTYIGSMYVKGPAGTVIYTVIRATGSGNPDVTGSANITLTGAWQRVSTQPITTTAPATNIAVMARVVNAVPVTFWADAGLIEKTSTLLPYFDGTSAAADGLTYSWVGAANASESVATGVSPAGFSFARSVGTVTVVDGYSAVRIQCSNTNNDTYIGPLASGTSSPASNGATQWTIAFDIKPVGKALNSFSQIYEYDSAGVLITGVQNSPVVNAPADVWTRVSYTYALRPNTAYVRAITGFVSVLAAQDVYYIKSVVSEAGATTGAYFDGSSETATTIGRWTGATELSASEEIKKWPLSILSADGVTWNTLREIRSRTNLATNPSGELANGWSTNNATYWTVSNDTTVKRSGTQSKKSVAAVGQIGYSRSLLSMYNLGGTGLLASPGKVYATSAYFAMNSPEGGQVRITYQFLDAGGTAISTTVYSPYFPVPGNSTFVRAYVISTPAPAGTGIIRIGANLEKMTTVTAAPDVAWTDDCLVEEAFEVWPYFDGRTAADPDYTYSWFGVADQSKSIATPR